MLRLRARLGSFWSIILGLIYLLIVFFVGISYYMGAEDWDFASSFYMVVITLSTVGFMEVNQLSEQGRIFTAFMIMGGVGGFCLYCRCVCADHYRRTIANFVG